MNLLYIGKYVRNIVVFIEFLLFLYYTNFNITMLKKRIFYVFALALFCSLGRAQVKHKLVVQTVDDQTEEYKLENISKITFSDDYMNITPWNSMRSDSYAFDIVARMYFVEDQDTTDGLSQVSKSPLSFLLSQAGQTVSVSGMEKPADMYLYDTAGVVKGKVKNWDGKSYSIASLPAGTYIMMVGNHPFKFAK